MKIKRGQRVRAVVPVQGKWFVWVEPQSEHASVCEATAIVYYDWAPEPHDASCPLELCAEYVGADETPNPDRSVVCAETFGRRFVGMVSGATPLEARAAARQDVRDHVAARAEARAKQVGEAAAPQQREESQEA